ncbi:tryptophan 7-halogenase [soil metagenome]
MTNRDTIWDVIIIGAGPAGSTLALALRQQRLNVLLLDQSRFPRPKVCGGCLNGNALAALATLGLSNRIRNLGGQPIQSLQLSANHRTAHIALASGVSLSREVLDESLIQAAIEAGVTFESGVRATMQDVDGDVRHCQLRSDAVTTTATSRVVILAHGLKAGAVAKQSWIGAGVVLDEVPLGYLAHTISMAVGTGGYVGGVHVEAGRFDLAAALDVDLVKAHGGLGAAAVAIQHQAGFPEIPGLANAAWKGTPQLTRQPKRIAGQRWFAVGDAAGYVEPFTGEGMAWAITGAIALAPIVRKAVMNWNDAHATQWHATHVRQVGRRQRSCRMLRAVLHSPRLASGLVRVLSFAPKLASPVVRLLSRPAAIPSGVTS